MAKNELMIINEKNIEDKIYVVRGERVMLDYDLAAIYEYETRYFNRQVRNNIDRFDDDFMFQLTNEEWNKILKCKNFTSSWGGSRKKPYAFTEQGIYMLMTVLRGEKAIKQSIAIIRLFKGMKDILTESNNLLEINEILKLSKQVDTNTKKIDEIEDNLSIVMKEFHNPAVKDHYLIKDGQRLEADIAFKEIYALATKSIILIDDYINVKTLMLLKASSPEVNITIISDNNSKDKITDNDIIDFKKDTGRDIKLIPSHQRVHDRYIILDYLLDNERIFHSGSSSKDSGNRITTIMEIDTTFVYHNLIEELLSQ